MNAEVEQALGDIDRPNAVSLLPVAGKRTRACMSIKWQVVDVLEIGKQIIGVQHGVFADQSQSVRAVHPDIAIGPDVHAKVSVEAMQTPDAFCRLVPPIPHFAFLGFPPMVRADTPRVHFALPLVPNPGTSTVRRREGLMKVVVHDIDPEIAWTGYAKDRIEIRAVVVNETAGAVNDLDHFLNVLVPQPERVRIRDHQRRRVRSGKFPQPLNVDIASWVRPNRHDVESRHRRGRRIRPMG